MRKIALIITMGDDEIVTLSMDVSENIASRMEASEQIKLRVMVKPNVIEDENEN